MLSQPTVVQSFGMGVDSVALLLRWITRPASRDFELGDLVVVTAMTGNEHERTGAMMQEHIVPLLREHGICYVQLSRAGQKRACGYTVLSDSRATERMHMRGPWQLSDEMRSVGTVPSVQNGRRWCSDRAKGEPIDWWVADHCEPGYTHVMGFAAEEGRRARRDTAAREEKAAEGKALPCRPRYPLIEWRWDRQRCQAFIREVLGVEWPRSCCTYCPFQATAGSRGELVGRWRDQPEAGADAVELEYTALALNERIGLFGVRKTAMDLVEAEGLTEVWAAAERRLAAVQAWSLVEVRRVFRAKGNDAEAKGRAWRSIRVRASGTREAMLEALHGVDDGRVLTDACGIARNWREALPTGEIRYPAVEWFWTVVPAGVASKQMPGFETVWTQAHTAALC